MSVAFAELQQLQDQLIRKAVNGSIFLAPSTAATIDETTLFTTPAGEISTLPTGYKDLGFTTDAGAVFARAITESPVTSWQSVSPTRSDRTADTTTCVIVPQETKLATIAAYIGVDPATVTHTTNGVVRVDRPIVPADRTYRLLVVSEDTKNAAGSIYVIRYLPNAKVTDVANVQTDKADEITWGLTFTGFTDTAVGTADSFIFGGPGFKALLTDMGFDDGS